MNILNLKESQVYRLKKIFINEGKKGFIHKNRGKKNLNKKASKMIEEIDELYLRDCYDFNFEHFYEEHVFGKYNISYDGVSIDI